MLMNLCGDDREAALGEFRRIASAHGLDVKTTKDLQPAEIISIWQEVKQLHDAGIGSDAVVKDGGELPLNE